MDNEIDIIGLSETRLDETVKDQDVSINGYRIYRNDRNPNGGGGGGGNLRKRKLARTCCKNQRQ